MTIEVILARIMLLIQLGMLVWSVTLCVQAALTRRKIKKIIKMWEGEDHADRDAGHM